jgi:N-glycosylase/DNA lyase
MEIEEIKKLYNSNKRIFEDRLSSFKKVWTDGNDLKIFEELCYCICTPREKVENALNAIKSLTDNNYDLLINGDFYKIDKILEKTKIALHSKKADRIIKNRDKFYPNTKEILKGYNFDINIKKGREKLIHDVVGFGPKESSHFLRNIGFGSNLAIIDRHIKKQLEKYKVIEKDSKMNTKKQYYDIEEKMIKFAKEIERPVDILDMVLMYSENKEIIK